MTTETKDRSPNPNTNCLEGIRCPKCGYTESFNITATCVCEVTDDGIESYGDAEWESDAVTSCRRCQFMSKLKDFEEKTT